MVMRPTDVECEMVKTVVKRFLNMKESTPRTLLVRRFKDPDAVDHLVQSTVFRTHDGAQTLWPMALAFVIRVLQNLFEVEIEKTDFTPADVEAHARKMYDTLYVTKDGYGPHELRIVVFPDVKPKVTIKLKKLKG
jgi:hypothetical protein